jgi:hypothetical protein
MIKNSILTLYLALNIGFVFAVKFKQPPNNPQELSLNNEKKMLQNETHLFEENKGQVTGAEANQVQYVYKTKGLNIFLLNDGLTYQFQKNHYPEGYHLPDKFAKKEEIEKMQNLAKEIRTETYRMDMKLLNSNSNSIITAEGKSSDFIQYYNHNALDVHSFAKVTYHDVYPNIDWVVYKEGIQIKYNFIVHPGGDPSQIQLKTKWVQKLKINNDGSLLMKNRMGSITEQKPVSYQADKEIATSFKIKKDVISFDLKNYDTSLPLIIDPYLQWANYYGGEQVDIILESTVDSLDNVYLCGNTKSIINISMGGYQNSLAGGNIDAFLAKFDKNGVRLWATYYGGFGIEIGSSCALDTFGNVYMTGSTSSTSNIFYNGFQSTYGGGIYDAFLVKLDSSGVRLWATYYGGNNIDLGYHCTVSNLGDVYISGNSSSTSSISFNGHQNIAATLGDAILVKFNSNGLRLWATYYGGNNEDEGYTCMTDSAGNVYMSGYTISSTNISFNGHQNIRGGQDDAFLVKFNSNGVRQWGTYYGGSLWDSGYHSIIDKDGFIYLCGGTKSANNIGFNGHQNSLLGVGDGFIVKFNPNGIRIWATYYGGSDEDYAYGCVTSNEGKVYLTGETNSFNNIAFNGFQNSHSGGTQPEDAFLAEFNSNGNRLWATYYGGTGQDIGRACTIDNSNNIYLVGHTYSADFFVTGVHQNSFGGMSDGFFVKFGCPYYGEISETACNNYTINGQTYTNSGNYIISLINAAGCDSILNLNLTVNNPSVSNLVQTHCDSYTINGQTFDISGTYTQTLTNAAGCDSVLNLNLTIYHATSSTINVSTCNNYLLNGQTYSTSGVFTQNLINALGCDSLITLNLNIYPLPLLSISLIGMNLEATPGYLNYIWKYNGNIINGINSNVYLPVNNGNYEVEVIDSNGCSNSASFNYNLNNLNNFSNIGPLTIHPNPAKGEFYIDFIDNQEKEIQIFNSEGKLVFELISKLKHERFETLNLANGIYLIKVSQNNNYETKSLMIHD